MTEAHLSFDQVRAGQRDLAERRREARADYEQHSKDAAEADREFRKKLAIGVATHRRNEKGFGESEILAQGDAAELRAKRDMAQALAKAALLRIDELERDQATLRQLADFSKEMETGRG